MAAGPTISAIENPRQSVQSILDIAVDYTRRGWSVLPVRHRQKKPNIASWQQLRLTEQELPRYFDDKLQNIGVLLGEPSQSLVDVDLDHPLALELAQKYLPPTGLIFGRASKPRSHWLYYGARPVVTKQWRAPNRQMVVELRSTGAQTVFPGSVHETGESIEWDMDGELAVVDPDEMCTQLQALHDEVLRRIGLPSSRDAHPPVARYRGAPSDILDRAHKYLAKLPPAVSGQGGHNKTFFAACTLVIGFGLDREQALALLREWNQACQPPWTDKELEHKVDDALKPPGWRGHLLSGRPGAGVPTSAGAIERANRHAIEHRQRARRRALA